MVSRAELLAQADDREGQQRIGHSHENGHAKCPEGDGPVYLVPDDPLESRQ